MFTVKINWLIMRLSITHTAYLHILVGDIATWGLLCALAIYVIINSCWCYMLGTLELFSENLIILWLYSICESEVKFMWTCSVVLCAILVLIGSFFLDKCRTYSKYVSISFQCSLPHLPTSTQDDNHVVTKYVSLSSVYP